MITIKEEFISSPKAKLARKLGGSDAILMWLALKTYSAKNLTDGFVPDEAIADLEGAPRKRRRSLEALANCGPTDREGNRQAGLVERSASGWQLHDYLDHEQSAATVKAKRRSRAERQKRWRNGKNVAGVDGANVDAADGGGCRPHVDGVDGGVDALRARARAHVPSPLLSSLRDPSLREGSQPSKAGSQAEEQNRKPSKPNNKPVPCPEDFAPDDRQAQALATKHGVTVERIRSRASEFRWYWRDGGGAGQRRSLRGWVRTFGNRIDAEAQRGVLYAEPTPGPAPGRQKAFNRSQDDLEMIAESLRDNMRHATVECLGEGEPDPLGLTPEPKRLGP